jgi:hypothetical protein
MTVIFIASVDRMLLFGGPIYDSSSTLLIAYSPSIKIEILLDLVPAAARGKMILMQRDADVPGQLI